MAWEWSHTQEGYNNAYENLKNLEYDDLLTIYAEIVTCQCANRDSDYPYQHTGTLYFNEDVYNGVRCAAEKLDAMILIEFIWQEMNIFRTCDNGGWNAWACPHGCHTVSFSQEESI